MKPIDPVANAVDSTVSAEAAGKDDLSMRRELDELKKRLKDLESANKEMAKGDSKSKPADQAKSVADKSATDKKDGGWTDVSSEKWTVKLGGHIQTDLVTWASSSPSIPNADNYFNFRRLRLVADGTGYGVYDFRLQMTLEPDSESPAGSVTTGQVKDAYFSMNEIPWLGRFRIGHFFVPFGLEQVTNDTMNIFMERSIPTQGIFTADREVGIALYNATPSQTITWSTGLFLDSISEGTKKRLDDNQGYRLSGRLTCLPYYDEPSNGRYLVHTGLGILHTGDQDKRVRFRARPQVSEGPRLVDTGILSADAYTTGNVEGAVVWGRFTVQSEAYLTSVDLLNGYPHTASRAYVHTSYFLTGENRVFELSGQHGAQFGRNVPFSNFFATSGGISPGAWEFKTRWSQLDLNNFNAGQYNDLTVGLNWYWNDRTRIMFDWIHPITSASATFGATQSDLIAMRFDVNW